MTASKIQRDFNRLSKKDFAKKYGIKVSEINKLKTSGFGVEDLEERISKYGPKGGIFI